MNPSLAVAVAQLPPTNDPAENRASIDAAVREAAAGGARLIVLPEEALLLADGLGDDLAAAVEASWPAGLELVSDLARTLDVWVIVGGYEPHGADRPYNTLVMIDADGRIAGTYRKIHLYDAFSYKARFEVRPDIAEVKWEGFEVKRPSTTTRSRPTSSATSFSTRRSCTR